MRMLILLLLLPLSFTQGCSKVTSDQQPGKAATSQKADATGLQLEKIKLPPGFQIAVYARVPNARSLALGDNGTLFVSNRSGKSVYAVVDSNKDNVADEVITLASGLTMPNGVAFRNGALYVAGINRIWRYDGIESQLKNPPQPTLVSDALPSDRHHGWKFIAFGPDGMLYVPVGAPCNICERDDPRYASILRIKPEGGDFEVFASGIRNTVGFDWNPRNPAQLWFTDNGRDMMGDEVPPDELNLASKKGMHFGFPYCHGAKIPDPEFGKKRPCSEFVPPARELGPHVAALGMRFHSGKMFPGRYWNSIFIAEHGSWNRTKPIGYRIMVSYPVLDGPMSYEVFAEGWLQGGKAWGRPVDVLVMPDGALLVSDDESGTIYRIAYKGRR